MYGPGSIKFLCFHYWGFSSQWSFRSIQQQKRKHQVGSWGADQGCTDPLSRWRWRKPQNIRGKEFRVLMRGLDELGSSSVSDEWAWEEQSWEDTVYSGHEINGFGRWWSSAGAMKWSFENRKRIGHSSSSWIEHTPHKVGGRAWRRFLHWQLSQVLPEKPGFIPNILLLCTLVVMGFTIGYRSDPWRAGLILASFFSYYTVF